MALSELARIIEHSAMLKSARSVTAFLFFILLFCPFFVLQASAQTSDSDARKKLQMIFETAGMIGNVEFRCFKTESVNSSVSSTLDHNKSLKSEFSLAFITGGLKGLKLPLSCDNTKDMEKLRAGMKDAIDAMDGIKKSFPYAP